MKKLNKFFAVLVALAMMATLCVSMAFADPAKQTTAPVTKTLTVPQGTTLPANTDIKFAFDLLAVNGADGTVAEEAYIASPKTLDLSTGTKTEDATNNVDVYSYTISDVLAGINWARPGVYEWNVKESVFTADDQNPDTEDHLNKDNTEYKMVVKVIYNAQGQLVVDEVIIKSGADDPTDPEDENWTEANGLAFNNAYYTTTGNDTIDPDDPDDPDDPVDPGDPTQDSEGLSVDKQVTGTYGDKNTPFEITVNLALPQISGADTAEAVIRRLGANGTYTMENVEITNGDNVISLKHGDKLVFTKLAEGTKYTVVETDTRKGTAAEQYTATGEVTTATPVVKGTNAATITNKSNQDDITPTGILINNLPYIALALVAIGGLVAYVVVRRRNADEA